MKIFLTQNVKIPKRAPAFKGYARFFNVEILNYFNPELQLKDTESAIKNKLKKLLTELKVLVLVLKKIESDDKTKYNTFYSHTRSRNNYQWKWHVFESVYTAIKSNIRKSLGKGSGWITDSVIEHNINISIYNPLTGSSYIKLPKELDYARKGLINIQNIHDN